MANGRVVFNKWLIVAHIVLLHLILSRPNPLGAEITQSCPNVCKCNGSHQWDCSGLDHLEELWTFRSREIGGRSNVKLLNLSHSRLHFQEDFKHHFPSLEMLGLRDCRIHCSKSSVWLLDWKDRLMLQPESLTCTSPKTVQGVSMFKALKLINEVSTQCPDGCKCELAHLERRSDEQLVTVHVDCRNQSYNRLPEVLPSNVTIHLDLSNNQVEDLSELVTNPIYKRVTVLHLNHNWVKSISTLKNSVWIRHFSLLNLQGNLLEELPTETLTKVFDSHDSNRDVRGIRMFLSKNPWKCNCLKINNFQSFMVKHKELIKDVGSVTCGAFSDRKFAGKRVISLEPSEVCIPDNTGTLTKLMYWRIVNLILSFLLIFLVSSFGYNCHVYYTTQQLPAIAKWKYF